MRGGFSEHSGVRLHGFQKAFSNTTPQNLQKVEGRAIVSNEGVSQNDWALRKAK